ncbi:hypothetical protein GX48_03012 [Paracoccidioides brasiliensis]|nr:hypothetical protein GX48_03012 [Paracoccidioides brasiliensis]
MLYATGAQAHNLGSTKITFSVLPSRTKSELMNKHAWCTDDMVTTQNEYGGQNASGNLEEVSLAKRTEVVVNRGSKPTLKFYVAYAVSLKAAALVAGMRLSLESNPSPLSGTPPPPYDKAIADMPPAYMSQDEFAHCRIDTPDSALIITKGVQISRKDGQSPGNLITPISIDLNDLSKFRSHGKKQKKSQKKVAQDKWNGSDKGDDKGKAASGTGDGGNGDGGSGHGGAGGSTGGGGGGDDGGGDGDGDDDSWETGGGKKKKNKKNKKEEEEEREQKEKEEAERKSKEDEKKAKEAEDMAASAAAADNAGNSLSWVDDVPAANVENDWGEYTTKKKKKGKKNKTADPPPAEKPPPHSFQDINLDAGAPQLNLSFDAGVDTNKSMGFNFGGWANNWNTGGTLNLSLGDDKKNKLDDEKKEDCFGSIDAWAPEGKKGGGNDIFSFSNANDNDTSTGDANTEEKKIEDDRRGFAVIRTKDKRKKKGTPPIEKLAPNPVPAPDPEPADDWGTWSTSTKKDKMKKGANTLDVTEEVAKEPDPVVEPAGDFTAEDSGWDDGWGKKSKKSKAKAAEAALKKPDPPPEPATEDTWASVSLRKDKKKEVPEPPPEPVPDAKAEPEDNLNMATQVSKIDKKKKKGKLEAENSPAPPPVAEPDPINDWASVTTSTKRRGKKGVAVMEEAPVEPPPPAPEPEHQPEANPCDNWGKFKATSKKKKDKKGATMTAAAALVGVVEEDENITEEPPAPLPEHELQSEALDDGGAFTTNSKGKKGKKGSAVEDLPPEPPLTATGPEPESVDDWGGVSTSKKNKGKKNIAVEVVLKAVEETPEPAPAPLPCSEPVDEWAEFAGGKKKKGKKNTLMEPVGEAPAPAPATEPEPVVTRGTASSKNRGKKGAVVESLPTNPLPEPEHKPKGNPEFDPLDDLGFTTTTKKGKKGKKGDVVEETKRDVKNRAPVPETDIWATTTSKKDKKKSKVSNVEAPAPELTPVGENLDWLKDDYGDGGKVTKVDSETSKASGGSGGHGDDWSIGGWSFGSKKKDKKKAAVVEDPNLVPEPPAVTEATSTGADEASSGGKEVKKDKKVRKDIILEEKAKDPKFQNNPTAANDDFVGWADTTPTGRKIKKKGASMTKVPEEPPPPPPPPPPTSEAPEPLAADSWAFWGLSKSAKDIKGKKNNFLEREPGPFPKVEELDPWAGLSAKDRQKKEMEAKKKPATVAPSDESKDNSAADVVSTDLVRSPGLDDNSWWGIPADKKKGKIGKDANEPPPPAPTPPAQELDPEMIAVDVDGNDAWGAFTGSGSKITKAKKPSISRTTTTTSKLSKVENGKSSKPKSRGLEVVDITDEPKKMEEPAVDCDTAKGVKSFWGSFGAAPASTPSKSKSPQITEEGIKTVVEMAKDKSNTDGSKKSAKKNNKSALDDLVIDVHAGELEATSATTADKASAPSAPPKTTTTTLTAGTKVTGKTSVAERIRLLEQSKKREKEAAKEKEKLEEKERVPAQTGVPQQPASPPDLKPIVEPVAYDPLPSKRASVSSKRKATTVPSKSTSKKKGAFAATTATLLDESSTPRDSVPGSFPGAFDDDLIDIIDLAPAPAPGPVKSQPVKAPKAGTKPSTATKVSTDKMVTPPPPPPPPATAPDESKDSEATPSRATSKPVKKERARVERTAGASSWGFWGAAPKRPVKKETKPKEEANSSPHTMKKAKETMPPTLARSKSTASKRDKPMVGEKDVEKSSVSDKEKHTSATVRPSRHSRGMNFPNFMMGGAPPARTKSIKRNGASVSRPISRRPSVDIDDSGILSPNDNHAEISGKAAKLMGVNGVKTPRSELKGKKRLSKVPDPYAIDDDDYLVMVNGGDEPAAISPKETPKDSKLRRHKSKHEPKPKNADDDIVMVEPDSSGRPDVVSGPEDLAFVIGTSKERSPLKRSNTITPKKSEGFLGLFGSFRKPATRPDYSRPRYSRDEDLRAAETDKEETRRPRREKRRSTKVETDGEGFTTDAAPTTEAEDAEARKAERRTRRLSKHAEQEAREAVDRDAEERRAKRREAERARSHEAWERQAREDEEREQRRREEKRARRAALELEEQQREEERRGMEAKRRAKQAEELEEESRRIRFERRRSHMEKPRDKYSYNEYGMDHRRHRSHRSGDETAKSRRRKSSAIPGEEYYPSSNVRPLHRASTVPYPGLAGSGKEKTSSWLNSQLTNPPEVPPIVPTVIDIPAPAGDPHVRSLSSEDEARRATRRKARRHSKYNGLDDAELADRRARHRELPHSVRDPLKSSEGSGEGDRHGDRYGDRYASDHHRPLSYGNGTSKRSSWFKKITNL